MCRKVLTTETFSRWCLQDRALSVERANNRYDCEYFCMAINRHSRVGTRRVSSICFWFQQHLQDPYDRAPQRQQQNQSLHYPSAPAAFEAPPSTIVLRPEPPISQVNLSLSLSRNSREIRPDRSNLLESAVRLVIGNECTCELRVAHAALIALKIETVILYVPSNVAHNRRAVTKTPSIKFYACCQVLMEKYNEYNTIFCESIARLACLWQRISR